MMTPEEFQQFMAEQAQTRGPDISQEEVDRKRLDANLMDAGGEAAAIMTGREYKPSSNPLAGRLKEALDQRKAQQSEDEKRQFLLAQLQSRQVMDPQAKFNLEQAQLMAPDVQAKSRADAELAGKRVESYGQPSEQEKYLMQKFGLDKQKYEDTAQNRDLERQLLEKKLKGDERSTEGTVSERERFEYEKEKDRLKSSASESDLFVPGVGIANTKDDAKQLKEAKISRDNLNATIDEMIALREAKGAEFLDREAVGRGKQLSTAALLEMKNLAKLGVLSNSDADLLNKLIPSDPLGVTLSGDSIMEKLRGLSKDVDTKFQNSLTSRLRSPAEGVTQDAPKQELSSQDKQALEWANSNPDDPRAIKIKERLGAQ
jgi:hypothetical protein